MNQPQPIHFKSTLAEDGFEILRGWVQLDMVSQLAHEMLQLNEESPYQAYDLAKKLPIVHRLIGDPRWTLLFMKAGFQRQPVIESYGVRIDRANDPSHMAPYHQECAYQPGSGLGFWTPLQNMTPELGPLEIAAGSHKLGRLPLSEKRPEGNVEPYARLIKNEDIILDGLVIEKPLLNLGDLLLLDWNVLHKSGMNISDKPRLSLVWRMIEA